MVINCLGAMQGMVRATHKGCPTILLSEPFVLAYLDRFNA